jgi:hypothetical protein
VIAGLYGIAHAVASGVIALIMSAVVFALFIVPATGLWWAVRRAGTRWLFWVMGGVAALGLLILAGSLVTRFSMDSLFAPLFLALIATLGSGPLVTFCAFLLMSQWLFRNAPAARPFTVMAGWFAWLFSFCGSALATATTAMHYYRSLPTSQPSHCYIASMAARGHPRFVRAQCIRCADGQIYAVNDQLRVLKAGEVVIKALWPRGHAVMRRVYDAVGPRLAARVTNPYAADVAYLLLKLCELPATVALKAAALWPLAMQLYRQEERR